MPKSKKKIQQEYSESDNAFTESDELAKESAKDSVFYKSVDNGSHKINNEDEQIQEDARANFVETTFFERVVKYVKTDNLMRKEAKEHKEKMDTMKTNKQELEDFLVDYLESKKENTININGSGKLTKYKSIRKGGLNKDIIQKSMYDKLKAENIIDDDDGFLDDNIGDYDAGNSGYTGRQEKDDRHEWCCPEWIRLDSTKNKTDIAMQYTGHRDTYGS